MEHVIFDADIAMERCIRIDFGNFREDADNPFAKLIP